MFMNEKTREFPCWECKKYEASIPPHKNCPILMALLKNMPDLKELLSIKELTFKCDEIQWKKPAKALIEKLEETGMLRAALTYQEERVRLLFYINAYQEDGKLVQRLCDIWDDFDLLTRNPQVVVINHSDSVLAFREQLKNEAVTKVIYIDKSVEVK